MIEVLTDAWLDSLKMLPLLFCAYLVIEYLEHRSGALLTAILKGSGRFGPAGGAALGVLPQCGFSVAAANFYSGGIITRGTLIAVFLSTSDEAIPVLLTMKDSSPLIFSLIGLKLAVALICGFLIDIVDSRRGRNRHLIHAGEHSELCGHCHCQDGILKAAVNHTLRVFGFILSVSLILNGVFYALGEAAVAQALMSNSPMQPFITGIFGFIPNCAASVILTELLISGSISYGAAFAGLCTGAGFGLAVLLKTNRHDIRDNCKIILLLYAIGVGAGILLDLFL